MLQDIVEALVLSLPMLGDVMILALFYFAIFGILCVELFKGQLLYRCGTPNFSNANNGTIYGEDLLFVRTS